MSEGRIEYTFLWFYENYSFIEHGCPTSYISPTFHTERLGGTAWYVLIHPRGSNRVLGYDGSVSVELNRKDEDGPECIPLSFQFSLLAADGSALHSFDFKHIFNRGNDLDYFGWCADNFISTDELHVRRAEYLPNDTLTFCCKMWTGEGDVLKRWQRLKAERISARSRPITEKLSFSPVVERFSTLEPKVKKTIQIQSHSVEAAVLSFILYVIGENIIIKNVNIGDRSSGHKFEFFLKASNGDLINCGKTAVGENRKLTLTLSLTRQDILNNEQMYLPEDQLSLVCECTFATGELYREIEDISDALPLYTKNKRRKVSDSKSGVSEDMKALYNEQCLTDVQLKTKTKTFAAHKLVLCARSPVFKAMLTNDMREKITDCIQVEDLEDEIVQQLLHFLYSDSLEQPLQWRSATQLYYVADKYAVRKLQEVCSDFLVENLTTSNAIELLLLADVHNDPNLKDILEDFILENEEQVFGSSEWEKLIETNPQLGVKMMHLKYKKKAKLVQ